MATINLGKVKGEPFRYEDFTPEQLEGLKGKDFKFEDFSPEQLEGLRSKIKVGVVETLDADEQVRVTPRVEGNTTTLDFAIPRGNGVNSYSGTREQYESEKESIKDGSLVNITDENDFEDETLIGADTLRRVFDIESNMANIKPHAFSNPTNNLLATEPGTALDAVQGKVLNDMITAVNLSRLNGRQYSTLEDLVKATATDIRIPHYFRFKDLGGFVLGKSNSWYRLLIQYQNAYGDDVTYNIGGTGILWDADNVYRVFIGGTKATGVSLTLEKLVTETELNKKGTVTNVQLADATPVSVLTSDFSNITEVPLEKGNYLVVITVNIQKNATGNRGFYFGGNSTPTYATVTVPNSGANNDTRIQHTAVLEIGSKTNYYFAPYQNSGQSLNMTYSSIKIVKL
jgi:hypothetical protein